MGWEEEEDGIERGTGERGQSRRTGEVERWGYKRAREVGYGRRAHSERARKTAGRNDFDEGNESGVHREAGRENGAPGWACVQSNRPKGGLEEARRELPCGDGSNGEVVHEARRAWARQSSPVGSEGGEGSTGRGGKMGPVALGGVSGKEPRKGVGDRVSWTVKWLDLVPEMETR